MPNYVAYYDAGDGRIMGIYTDDMDLPTPTAAITEEERDAIIAHPDLCMINTTSHVFEVRTLTDDEKWMLIRAERNQLLTKSDWMVCSDLPVASGLKDDIEEYRQLLRDIPQTWAADVDGFLEVGVPAPPTYVKT